jgi:hypothetical protein
VILRERLEATRTFLAARSLCTIFCEDTYSWEREQVEHKEIFLLAVLVREGAG